MNTPENLIEHNGYVYKLLTSKEEQKKIDEQKYKDRERAFGVFKQKIGTDIYNFLKDKGVILSYSTGGNYSVELFFDFVNDETWTKDEYTETEKKHIGDTNWYSYDKTDFSTNFVSSSIQKMIADYFFSLIKK